MKKKCCSMLWLCCYHHPSVLKYLFLERKLVLRPFSNIEIIIIETIIAFQLLIDQVRGLFRFSDHNHGKESQKTNKTRQKQQISLFRSSSL